MHDDTTFWALLARRMNKRLRASLDDDIRFLWVDDFIPESVALRLETGRIIAAAHVSEDGGRSFVRYRVALDVIGAAADLWRDGDWEQLLPGDASGDWLTIDRTAKEARITWSVSVAGTE